MNITYFDLNQVSANPFQTREAEDPEHVKMLAESIKASTMLQIPTGRFEPMPEIDRDGVKNVNVSKIQLAFGHSRLAAYKLLNSQGIEGFDKFPVHPAELNDQEMFEQAVRENRDRKDLTPIEEAKAMLIYRQQFGKKSAEIGQLFQLSASAVRNRMRLLDLPAEVQAKVGRGISEGTARKLLTMMRVVDSKAMTEFTKELAKEEITSTEDVDEQINRICSIKAKMMWTRYQGEVGYAGEGLWKLTWTPGILEEKPSLRSFRGMLQKRYGEELVIEQEDFERMVFKAQTQSAEEIEEVEGISIRAAELLINLVNPPACTECPFYMVLNRYHYCGLQECWNRKKERFMIAELQRVHKKLKIPIYDPQVDGKGRDLQRWDKKDEELFKSRPESLRLAKKTTRWGGMDTGSDMVGVVDVSPESQKKIEKANKQEEANKEESDARRFQWELEKERAEQSLAFVKNLAVPAFSALLDGVKPEVLDWMARLDTFSYELEHPKAKELAELGAEERGRILREAFMQLFLDDAIDSDTLEKGTVGTAKHLRGLATTLGLELPEDWLKRAKEFEKAVSAETGETDEILLSADKKHHAAHPTNGIQVQEDAPENGASA